MKLDKHLCLVTDMNGCPFVHTLSCLPSVKVGVLPSFLARRTTFGVPQTKFSANFFEVCKFVITIERSELFEKCTFKKVSFDFFYGNRLVHMHPSFEQTTDAQITSLNVYEAIKDVNIVQTSLSP